MLRALGPLLTAALVLATCGCGSSSETSTAKGASASGAQASKRVRLAYFAPGTANALSAGHQKGIEEAADRLGATVTTFDAKLDPREQLNQIQTATSSGKFDAFVIFPLDGNAIAPVVRQAIQQGVKVVSIFSTIGPDPNKLEPQVPGLSSTVATGIDDAGRRLGQLTVDACGHQDPCKVAYLPGLANFFPEKVRLDAFKRAIAGSHVDLVAVQNGQYAAAPALKVTQDVLQAHPDLDVVTTSGDQMTEGAAQAVASAGKADSVRLIGGGASVKAVDAVRSGRWFGSYVILPETEGQLGARYAIAAARGKKVPGAVRSIDKSPIGPVLLKSNAGRFTGQWDG
ncbi:sugar ABC transporter substrate-binding protein [Baekduia alba]|uniref:sugar ABC transporter substrate-binding protein n=1 Tax=Baekduia alba TaxID=2997333 RepID=UPI002340EABA|nr:sugar ABC transporter substrate-binding protein [Baekduia alba]